MDLDRLPPRLAASWQRSEAYGVPLEGVEPVFTGTAEGDSLFHQVGREVLGDLHRTLANEPISLMLTDPDGLVLNRLSGDHSLLRALDKVHLAPGFAYSEREAGTNGLGLALADRVPTVVRADQHYSLSLCTYTCAAAPVLHPDTGRLEGCVNITTWSDSSTDLLLALAQSAAGTTAARMLTRGSGRPHRRVPRGEVFRVEAPRLEPGASTLPGLSLTWTQAVARATDGLSAGQVVAAVGEVGSGRATMLAQAARAAVPRDRILAASPPDPRDAETWLDLWTPELGKAHTAVVVRDVDLLPEWVAGRLRALLVEAREAAGAAGVPFAVTAERFEDIPAPLAGLVGSVVPVAPLRERVEDIAPLAAYAVRRARGRDVTVTPAALRVLADHPWPGNVAQLVSVLKEAATRGDPIDVPQLPAEALSDGRPRLTRIEAFERDEIVRVLNRPGTSVREAADELGMSRATIYRKIGHYGLRLPR